MGRFTWVQIALATGLAAIVVAGDASGRDLRDSVPRPEPQNRGRVIEPRGRETVYPTGRAEGPTRFQYRRFTRRSQSPRRVGLLENVPSSDDPPMIFDSKDLQKMLEEWERDWLSDQPDLLPTYRTHGQII